MVMQRRASVTRLGTCVSVVVWCVVWLACMYRGVYCVSPTIVWKGSVAQKVVPGGCLCWTGLGTQLYFICGAVLFQLAP